MNRRDPRPALYDPPVSKRRGGQSLAICLATAFVAAPSADAQATNADAKVTRLQRAQQTVFGAALEAVAPSIVKIETIGGALPVEVNPEGIAAPRPARPGFRQADGPTTGVVWTADGTILTSSFNFVRDPAIITVTLHDGRRFVARLVARDRPGRLALLKIDCDDLPVPRRVSPADLRPGQWALAAGFGYGSRTPALSVGNLSALHRMSGTAVQTDAKISPANYGGPLFDIEGRVIGICVPRAGDGGEDEIAGVEWYDSGTGFAVHVDFIELRLPRLRKGSDLQRGLMGIVVDRRDPVVGSPDNPSPTGDRRRGLAIRSEPRGPAADAGLRAGDQILEVNGDRIERWIDLRRALARRAAGDSLLVKYRRGETVATTRLTLVSEAALAAVPTSQPG